MAELQDVQAGDELVSSQIHGQRSVVTVDRVTKTQIIVDHGRYVERFRKSTGRRIGSDAWAFAYVRKPRKGEIDEIYREQRHRKLAGWLSSRCERNKLSKTPVGVLEEMFLLLRQCDEETDQG